MVNYRRNYVKGGTYFFTVTLADRRSAMLTEHIDLLREAFRTVRKKRPFEIVAIVVLPEHLHTVWTLPEGDDDYPGRWRAIKSGFTRGVRKYYELMENSASLGETGILKDSKFLKDPGFSKNPGFRFAASRLRCDNRGEYRVWQRRYWEHTIRDEIDLQRHVDYIHFNPVKHGLVERVADWPYSSFHRYVRNGGLYVEWGGASGVREYGCEYGE